MSLNKDFIRIINFIGEKVQFDLIDDAFFPDYDLKNLNNKFNKFGAIKLADGAIGIVYIGLSHNVRKNASNFDFSEIINLNPVVLAKEFNSTNMFRKTLALGAINAISQSFFKKSKYPLDFVKDSLGLLELKEDDIVGMVGYFPSLVESITKLKIPLIVIEKKNHLVQKNENWEVTLDPRLLKRCNKILCTSITVLNETVDEILYYCKNAEKVSMIGPTAGFIPDPLFQRGIDIIGGTFIKDPSLFMRLIKSNQKWGTSTVKFCINSKDYPGYLKLIQNY